MRDAGNEWGLRRVAVAMAGHGRGWLLTALLLSLPVAFVWLGGWEPQRVGDGAEYYALFLAWSETGRPWLSPAAFDAYDAFARYGGVAGVPPREWLEGQFPALRLGGGADLNHFWFYSLMAFAIFRAMDLLDFGAAVHRSFLALHLLMLAGLAGLVHRLLGARGLAALAVMTLGSPILWYLDKAHTELFTFCTVTASIVFLMARRHSAAALMLALASTQNPSFAILAAITLLHRLVVLRRQAFPPSEVVLVVSAVLLALVHPAYYLARFGVPTPTLIAGGLAPGAHLALLHVWLIDPDLGLLPNWPAGILLMAVGAAAWAAGNDRRIDPFLAVFTVLFVAVNVYAHSSTTNLNSGATPGLARYALWYLPASLPLLCRAVAFCAARGIVAGIAGCVAAGALALLNVAASDPRGAENYQAPSPFSRLLQRHAGFLYDPPAEVWAERFSGLGEQVDDARLRAIMGPDCRKMLVYPGADRAGVNIVPGCFLDAGRLEALADALAPDGAEPRFVRLDAAAGAYLHAPLQSGSHPVGIGRQANRFLLSGWGRPEDWGVWSIGARSSIAFPCDRAGAAQADGRVGIRLFVEPLGVQTVRVRQGRALLYEAVLDGGAVLGFSGDPARCGSDGMRFEIEVSDPASPFALGRSADRRVLGLALYRIEID